MTDKLESIDVLGVRVDKVSIDQALDLAGEMLKDGKKHYVVTPNVEFVMLAQKDLLFNKIINGADLAIPDSARFGWTEKVLKEKSRIKRLLLIPFVVFPKSKFNFPVTTGVDFMAKLCQESADRGVTVGFLGGGSEVAEKTAECLQKSYPKLKIGFAGSGPKVNIDGEEVYSMKYRVYREEKNKTEKILNTKYNIQNTDILFVAFGQGKQEKWIYNNLPKLPVKVMMGVGGSFDYLSGLIPRAPLWMRNLGLEWFYRLIKQPWRIKRQLQLVNFVWKIVMSDG